MLNFDRDAVAAALPPLKLIDALDAAFAAPFTTPVRSHHELPAPGDLPGNLLLMPAWQDGSALGVKIATVFPDNARRSLPSVYATCLLLDADTGAPRAVMDGGEITLRRTAAASALASRYLSRSGAGTLLMVGTGRLAVPLILAHTAVRPIHHVLVWGRRSEAAAAVAAHEDLAGLTVESVDALETAVPQADIVSCATLAVEPLLRGAWLRAGQHLDLVGAFRPDMREADDEAMRRAAVWVDTFDGAFSEAGDVLQAIDSGALTRDAIRGDLAGLARGQVSGRRDDDEITVFKSVGTALEDLVAARLVADAAG